jgi:hypothetical protein
MFRTTLETIPGHAPYIHPDPARVAAWRERLGETSDLTLDFDAGASVQVNQTGSGQYILRPVVTPVP